MAWFYTVIFIRSFFLCTLFRLVFSTRWGLYRLGFGFCMILDIFSSKMRFSLSISVYRPIARSKTLESQTTGNKWSRDARYLRSSIASFFALRMVMVGA